MKPRLFAIAFAAIGLVGAPAAYARGGAMACYPDTIPFTLTNFSLDFSFPLFDPDDAYGNGTNAQANLTKVTLWLEGELSANVSLTNVGESPTLISGSLMPLLVVERPDLSPLLSVMLNTPLGPIPLNGLATVNVGPLEKSESTWGLLNSATDLALFTGPGILSLPVVGTGSFFGEGGGGNVVSNASTAIAASMNVCYHFNSTPEPGTSALLLCGFAGLIVRKQRLKRFAC